MLKDIQTELAAEIVGLELPVDNLRVLFGRVNGASGVNDILGCLVDFKRHGLSFDATLERLNADDRELMLPANRVDVVAEILTSLLDRLDEADLEELFEQASRPADIRSLVNLLVNLQRHGVDLESMKFGSDGVKNGVDVDGLLPVPTDLECPQPGQKDPKVRKTHRRPGLYGMKPPENNGSFPNSPQKDRVREMWGSRLSASFESGVFGELKPEDASVVSLMGEDARELPIYDGLGIAHSNIFSPEFSRKTFERMQGKVPFNVFQGNLYGFAGHLFEHDPGRRFSVANIDLCSTAEEFFGSGDHYIFDWLADKAEVSVNTRVRQDYVGIDVGAQFTLEISDVFPEIKVYFDKILEAKMRLFPDPIVARNMALRQFFFLFRMIFGFHSKPMDCCRDAIGTIRRWAGNYTFISNYLTRNGTPVEWGEDPVEQELAFFSKIFSNSLADSVEKLGLGEMRANTRDMVRSMSSMFRKIGLKESDMVGTAQGDSKRAEMVRKLGLPQQFENHGLALLSHEGIDPLDPRREEIEQYRKLFEGMSLSVMTRQYINKKITDLSCVTYGHGSQNTFQTWMMRFEKSKEPVSLLDSLKQALDLLVNSEEVVIDTRMSERRFKPEKKVVVHVAGGRILDWHRDYASKLKRKDNPGCRKHLTQAEKERRKRKRRIQTDSRRVMRERRK